MPKLLNLAGMERAKFQTLTKTFDLVEYLAGRYQTEGVVVDFICIGLDLRKVGNERPYSADASVWDQDTELYAQVKSDFLIKENSLLLLKPENSSEIFKLLKVVNNSKNVALISLELPRRVFEAYPYHHLIYPLHKQFVDDSDWDTLGLDICDINGFFSFLNMTRSLNRSIVLFDESRLIEALIVAQAANLEIPSHAPFVVVRLRMHRKAV